MAKLKLKPLEEMNQQQQLVYEMLNTGDREVYSGYKFTKSNLSRRKLSERLKMDDVNARKVVKSLFKRLRNVFQNIISEPSKGIGISILKIFSIKFF